MAFTRFILGTIGVFGFLGWCLFSWVGYVLQGWGDGFVSSGFSSEEWFMALAPLVTFLFYLAIAIRPCHTITALIVGIAVQIPLIYVAIPLLKAGHEGPIYAFALLPGFMVWSAYVYQLSHHSKKAV